MDRRAFLTTTISAAMSSQAPAWTTTAQSGGVSSGVVGEVKAEDIVVVYNSKSSPEAVAAQELHKYLCVMTGSSPRLLADDSPEDARGAKALFLVGRTPAMAQRISRGSIADPGDRNAEAYTVRSLGGKVATEVAFLGGTGIATLYAVYHYLEQYCQVGFFQDGDNVPRRNQVPAQGVSIAASPHFAERMEMNLTLYWYSAPWWNLSDWKAYIDWALKNRFNILSLWDTPGEDLVWHKVWKQRGVEIADQSYSGPPFGIFAPCKYGIRPPLSPEWRQQQSALNRQIIQYARARGMRTLAPAVPGIVPPEFPHSSETFCLSWRAAGMPRQRYLNPASRAYRELGKAFLEEYNSLFGTDHLYWLENYLECVFHETPESAKQVCADIARSNFQIVSQIDPQAVGYLSAWTYLMDPSVWTPEVIQKHLEGIPEERVRLIDQWAEMIPVHKRTDYFFGRPWHFGVVYSFAYNRNLHGDVRFIQKQLQDVAKDPGAKRCVGFYPNWESIGHNYFYCQFLSKLGWNPSETDLAFFMRDYAVTRYGAAGTSAMQRALGELLASVYGSDDLMPPAYWYGLGAMPVLMDAQPYVRFGVTDRTAFIPHLRRALELALEAQAMLASNPHYLHDLNDIARQYLAELFNVHVHTLEIAAAGLDAAAFEQEAALLETFLEAIERLLSHDDYYWLSPSIRKAMSLPGAPADVAERARAILMSFGGAPSDYAVRDCYEMMQGYYRPRVRAYLQTLRELIRLKQRMVFPSDEMDKQYAAIGEKWMKNGIPPVESRPDPRRTIETAERVLDLAPGSRE